MSELVELLVGVGTFDPKTAKPMKTSQKNRLCIISNVFAIIASQLLKRWDHFGIKTEMVKSIGLAFPYSRKPKI